MRKPILALLIAAFLANQGLGQSKVTSLDFYGLRSMTEEQIKEAIGISDDESVALGSIKDLKERIVTIEGVEDAYVAPIRYPGKLAIFIGIRETGWAPPATYRSAPKGDIKLRKELRQQYEETMELLLPAIQSGKAREDKSAGHSISEYEPMKKLQEGFVQIADEEFDEIAKVLRESSDTDSRQAAACILAYASDKTRVIEELMYASEDAHFGVRNNAVRALGIVSSYANANPDLGLKVDPRPFIKLLGSLTWTDRNKGAAVVDSLTVLRDPALMEALRSTSMRELEEMARWKSDGHALFSIRILARMAGESEEQIKKRAKEASSHVDRMKWVDELIERIEQPATAGEG